MKMEKYLKFSVIRGVYIKDQRKKVTRVHLREERNFFLVCVLEEAIKIIAFFSPMNFNPNDIITILTEFYRALSEIRTRTN